MKKSLVFLLLALAVIVLISPAIVGRLAEKSMDENLDWAATESNELTVTSQGFDRGWFSSEGQHRVELRDGELRDIDDILDILSIDLLGVVPEDKGIVLATDRGQPLALNRKHYVSQAYHNIANRPSQLIAKVINAVAWFERYRGRPVS